MGDSKVSKKSQTPSRLQTRNWLSKLEEVSGKKVELNEKVHNANVYLAIDCSSSMYGGKISHAKQGAIGFAREAFHKGYSVGLIKFDSNATHLLEPMKDIEQLELTIQKLFPDGSTNMSGAINIASTKLSDFNGVKVICIVTDGMPDNRNSTLEAANRAKREDIDIMTIGTDDADREFLAQLATRNDLAVKVKSSQFQTGITSMAKMLPSSTTKKH